MKNILYEYPFDSLLTSDEWDHVRYLIGEYLQACEVEGAFDPNDLPFLLFFESKIKAKLIKAGFEKDIIENPEQFEEILKALYTEGIFINGTWHEAPSGFPPDMVTFSKDRRTYWIKPDIKAALLALRSITIIKQLLTNNDAVKVYLRSLELTINLLRSGLTPGFARAEAEKKELSEEARAIKKDILRLVVKNIFNEFPRSARTLGTVWNKFDHIVKGRKFITQTGKVFTARTGKDGHDEPIVIITGADGKKYEYKKRSLQHFVDDFKASK